MAAPPSRERRVERDGVHALGGMPRATRHSARVLDRVDRATEADHVVDLGPLEFPRIARREPVFREPHPPPLLQCLPENAVVVANSVTVRGYCQRRHTLHEARGQPSKAPAAERSIRLEAPQPVEVDVEGSQSLARDLRQSEVAERVEEETTYQELERKV